MGIYFIANPITMMNVRKKLADFGQCLIAKYGERKPEPVEETEMNKFKNGGWKNALYISASGIVMFSGLVYLSKAGVSYFTMGYVFFMYGMAALLTYFFTTKKENLDDLIKETGYKGTCFMFYAIINISLSFVLLSSGTMVMMEEIIKCPNMVGGTGSVAEAECKEHPIAATLTHSKLLKETVPQAIFVIISLIIGTGFLITAAHQYRLRLYYVHKKLGIDEPSLIPKSQ